MYTRRFTGKAKVDGINNILIKRKHSVEINAHSEARFIANIVMTLIIDVPARGHVRVYHRDNRLIFIRIINR